MTETDRDGGRTRRSRREVLAAATGLGAGLVAGCVGGGSSPDAGGDAPTDDGTTTDTGTMAPADEATTAATDGSTGETTTTGGWRATELTDVLTGETFTVGGFDVPVVLETFAVWCPICTRQQQQLGSLKDSLGSDVAVVSLNIDPNEDASKVESHAKENGFDWHYAVSPPDLTKALADQFGNVVTNAPSAPVISVCQGGPAKLLEKSGVKTASTIEQSLGEC